MLDIRVNGVRFIPEKQGRPTVRGKLNIASALVKWRAQSQMTRQAVARCTGMADTTVGQIERGERVPRMDTFIDLVRLYQPPVDELLQVLCITQEPGT